MIITGAGGSGVLLSDACVDNGLKLMAMPDDLDAAFRKFIPPFGAAGNPVDITGGEPPTTYRTRSRSALDRRAHPCAHPRLLAHDHHAADGVRASSWPKWWRRRGPRASTSRSSPRWSATSRSRRHAQYLYEHGIVAYPYTTEKPVAVLGAKYKWAGRPA